MNFFSSSKEKLAKTISTKEKTIDLLKRNKYYFTCIEECFKNYVDYLNDEEKVCLCKCSDNLHVYFTENYSDLIGAKSKIN